MHYLTKTNFKLYLECPKHFWVKLNTPDQFKEKLSLADQHKIEQGYEVENLARNLFAPGIEMPSKLIEAVVATKEALKNNHVIYQATVEQANCLVRADIIVFDEQSKKWNIYEVKSSSTLKTKEHLPDIAFQRIVFEKMGIPIQDVFIVHLNKEYYKKNNIVWSELFQVENVTEKVAKIRSTIELQIQDAIKIMNFHVSDDLSSCYKPQECPCVKICHPNLPEYSIYDIARIATSKHLPYLRNNNIVDIHEMPDELELSENQAKQVQLAKKKATIIDKAKIKDLLGELVYPLYFLDYETFNSAIPLINGYKPNQQITFQYSLHILEKPEAEIQHCEYLANDLAETGIPLLNSLKHNIGNLGSIIVWNKSFEMRMNKEMAEIYPEYESFLTNINERVFDLMDIFKKNHYLDYRFKGSNSIKKVMPVLVPELSYQTLEVQNGSMAQVIWFYAVMNRLDKLAGKNKQDIFQNLLKYCKMDTWAMVKIFYKLQAL